jgi:hypothetical protein
MRERISPSRLFDVTRSALRIRLHTPDEGVLSSRYVYMAMARIGSSGASTEPLTGGAAREYNAGARRAMTDCRPVGLLCDYFAAATDEIAASTIDWAAGLSQPGKGPRRGLFRRGPSPQPIRTVEMKGIEPTVQMATLEAILTARPVRGILDQTIGLVIADRDQGERVVVRLTDSLQAALGQASEDELASAVARWSET